MVAFVFFISLQSHFRGLLMRLRKYANVVDYRWDIYSEERKFFPGKFQVQMGKAAEEMERLKLLALNGLENAGLAE